MVGADSRLSGAADYRLQHRRRPRALEGAAGGLQTVRLSLQRSPSARERTTAARDLPGALRDAGGAGLSRRAGIAAARRGDQDDRRLEDARAALGRAALRDPRLDAFPDLCDAADLVGPLRQGEPAAYRRRARRCERARDRAVADTENVLLGNGAPAAEIHRRARRDGPP